MSKKLPEQSYFPQRRDEFDAWADTWDRQHALDFLYAVSARHRPIIESRYSEQRANLNELRYRWRRALERYFELGGEQFRLRGRPKRRGPGAVVRLDPSSRRTGTDG